MPGGKRKAVPAASKKGNPVLGPRKKAATTRTGTTAASTGEASRNQEPVLASSPRNVSAGKYTAPTVGTQVVNLFTIKGKEQFFFGEVIKKTKDNIYTIWHTDGEEWEIDELEFKQNIDSARKVVTSRKQPPAAVTPLTGKVPATCTRKQPRRDVTPLVARKNGVAKSSGVFGGDSCSLGFGGDKTSLPTRPTIFQLKVPC